VARSLSDDGPNVTAQVTRNGSNQVTAVIEFTSPLLPDAPPFDFAVDFFGNNAFALNRWQFDCMYPTRNDHEEHLVCRIPPDIAVEELIMHVRFPRDERGRRRLPRQFSVRVGSGLEGHALEWQHLPTTGLIKIEPQGEAVLRIAHPIPGARYEIRWIIEESPDPTAHADEIQRALQLRSYFSRVAVGNLPLGIARVLQRVATEASVELCEPGHRAQLDVALFVYDAEKRALRYLVGTHSLSPRDPRRDACYPFGQGPVGRAFKSGVVGRFQKRNDPPARKPWFYVLPDGSPVTASEQVPEHAMLAFPWAPVEASDWPFAVVVVSTDQPVGRLKIADTATDVSIERFARAIDALTDDLWDMIDRRVMQ